MDIVYLKTVILVAKLHSFNLAAEAIPCSQSSVSRQVASVEKELGAQIFTHIKGGKAEMTAYGKSILPQLEQIVSSFDDLKDAAERVSTDGQRNIRMGLLRGPFNSRFKGELITHMFMDNPDCTVSLYDFRREDIFTSVISGEVDCALLYDTFSADEPYSETEYPGFKTINIFRKTPSIAMAADHPLAEKKSIDYASLKYETFALCAMPPGTINYDLNEYFFESCRRAGFSPKFKTLARESYSETRDAAVIRSGWMYPTFQTSTMNRTEDVVLVPVENPIYYCIFYLLYKNLDDTLAKSIAGSILKYNSAVENTIVPIKKAHN